MTRQITAYATNMIYAQGFQLTAADRAALVAKADRFREITGSEGRTAMNVPVRHPATEETIGHLTYML